MKTVTSKDGTIIAYDQSGTGDPLILVDGAMCHRNFGPSRKLAALLSGEFTVIIYDRRGRGESGDSPEYSVGRELEDLEALMEAFGGKANVFGISSGAGLAVLAAARGLPVVKLGLYEPPYIAGREGSIHGQHESKLRKLLSENRRGDAVRYFLSDMVNVPAPFVFMTRLMPVWKKLKAIAHTLPYDAAVMGDFTVPGTMIASIAVPTLIAAGEKSPARLREAANKVAEKLPDGTFKILKKQTHNINEKVLAPVLLDFFK